MKYLLAFTLLLILPASASACGTMQDWLDAFHGGGPQGHVNQKTALIGILECGRFHYEESHDVDLLYILIEAIETMPLLDSQKNQFPTDRQKKYEGAGSHERLIMDLTFHYRCLENAMDDMEYWKIPNILERPDACSRKYGLYLKVTAESGAVARMEPGGRRLGGLTKGAEVIFVRASGDWMLVYEPVMVNSTRHLGLVWVHGSLLERL